jgi:hypothetical protein
MICRQPFQAGRIGQRRLELCQVELRFFGGVQHRLGLGVGKTLLIPGPSQGQVKARKGLIALPPCRLCCPERSERRCIVLLLPAFIR